VLGAKRLTCSAAAQVRRQQRRAGIEQPADRNGYADSQRQRVLSGGSATDAGKIFKISAYSSAATSRRLAAVIRAVTVALVLVGLVWGRQDRSARPGRPPAWKRRTHL